VGSQILYKFQTPISSVQKLIAPIAQVRYYGKVLKEAQK
jgi:hypothetical protein